MKRTVHSIDANMHKRAYPGIGKKPKTDADALASCHDCTHLINGKCELLGVVTIKVRQTCFEAGYMDFRFPQPYGRRQAPHLPPCE